MTVAEFLPFSIAGLSGRLWSGSRMVATFGRWEARAVPGPALQVQTGQLEPVPFWWDHHCSTSMRAELDVGQSVWNGKVLESRTSDQRGAFRFIMEHVDAI